MRRSSPLRWRVFGVLIPRNTDTATGRYLPRDYHHWQLTIAILTLLQLMSAESVRPRRSGRAPAKGSTVLAETSAVTQPKHKDRESNTHLEYLLTNPKSKLTTLDISVRRLEYRLDH